MTERGVTLIELLVAVSIIAVLTVALGFSVEGWLRGYKVESATRQIYADLVDARTRALQGDHDYIAVISATDAANNTDYSIMEDSNDNDVADDSALSSFPKTIAYEIEGYDGSALAVSSPVTLTFSKRGIISQNPAATEIKIISDTPADFNCMTFAATRIQLGKYSGGACVAK